jgi:DNA topoisomerase I
MEDELDAISRGEELWTTALSKFWKPFIEQVKDVEKNVSREQVAQARDLGRDPVSGKPISVRMGRFGPFVQIGTKDDEEKPRFAGLRPGQKMDAIVLEQALELFKLPRTLGTTAAGEPIIASIGRFGPYIKYGAKYVSLKDDPYTVTLERALECIRIKEEADANRIIQDFGVDNIQVLNGRYGPYVTNREKNARAPKERDPKTLTLDECRALLEAAPLRGRGRGRFGAKKKNGAAATKPAPAPSTVSPLNPPSRAPITEKATRGAPTALAARRTAAPKVQRVAAPKHKGAVKPKLNAKARTKAAGKAQHKSAAGGARSRAGAKKAAGAA